MTNQAIAWDFAPRRLPEGIDALVDVWRRALAVAQNAPACPCHGIVPGRIDTPRPALVAHDPGERRHKSPLGRSASSQEIANLVRFLCSDECRFMTGAMLHANGAAYVTIG